MNGGTFSPDQTTTCEQIAAMLYRALAYMEKNGGKGHSTDIFHYTDNAQVADYAKEAVGALASTGVMKGTSDTTLSLKPLAPWNSALL